MFSKKKGDGGAEEPDDIEDFDNVVPATPFTAEDLHEQGVKIWFEGSAVVCKPGMSSMFRSAASKTRRVFVMPGRVCWIKADITDRQMQIRSALLSSKVIPITAQLKESVSRKEVSLEYECGSKTRTVSFAFEKESAATGFLTAVQSEQRRQYLCSANFTPRFQADLNVAVRARVLGGDAQLQKLFLACCNENAPSVAVEALFSNYLSLIDFEEPSAPSFATLLSAVASDPVIYILFLCCSLEANASMLEHFRALRAFNSNSGRPIDSYVDLFDALLLHIHTTVSRAEWLPKRRLFLAQFQYPGSPDSPLSPHSPNSHSPPSPGSPRFPDSPASIVSYAVFAWTASFTDDYRKFQLDVHTLNRILEDDKFLCFACLQHHADKGYVRIVQQAFTTVPQEYLFSRFDLQPAGEKADGRFLTREAQSRHLAQAVPQCARPHFVDFLFHRNLKEKNLFLTLLQSFQRGQGYDDKFFALFLHEAVQRDAPRIAVNVLNSILFLPSGEPSVKALKFCPKIPIILFEALLSGLGPGKGQVSDDLRLLLEVCLRFEYFVYRPELSYIKTLARAFRDSPQSRMQFMQLQQSYEMEGYLGNVCAHNLLGRSSEGVEGVAIAMQPSAPDACLPAAAAALPAVLASAAT
eukprot:CAMPEP_0173342518 /NCGR_PEP_ID=MMETSP1144-20121109/10266_1 /TAXON_ID=483371 /ORGANISM="non described non described, Strain CCMP2298" /LENGTH=636 /DNA_ID=CAMNT_0014289149 /DNA_START=35 /DNA_END=1941 /DNA_ORIENTATION=+